MDSECVASAMLGEPESQEMYPMFPKPHQARSKAYLRFIREQGCVICKRAAEAAHIGPHSLGSKTDDMRCVSLCHRHHVAGHDSLHHLGTVKFEEIHNVDLKELQIRFLIRYLVEVLHLDDSEDQT